MFNYILKKEFLLIFRDIHALLVLFVMPALFILIMSLALKNNFSESIDKKLNVIISNQNKTLEKDINGNSYFSVVENNNLDDKINLYDAEVDFIINISKDYKNKINENNRDFKIEILTKPDMSRVNYEILKNLIIESISKEISIEHFKKSKINVNVLSDLNSNIKKIYVYKNDKLQIKPNSTQQSVPAWLIFSMFFILIPISNTFIAEKKYGTLSRIRSINVSFLPILLGKIIPYYLINQIQVIIMFFIGIYIVPICGGEPLIIKNNYFLIFCFTSIISIAAICFALFIANLAKTTEEATSIGGVSNIILAALGGIMVPKFIMPEFMQKISELSPMSWSLEGLLEIFVRGGSFNDIKMYILYLSIFAITFLILAYLLLLKKEKTNG